MQTHSKPIRPADAAASAVAAGKFSIKPGVRWGALVALLTLGSSIGPSQAQMTNYTAYVLNGCYGFQTQTVDTVPLFGVGKAQAGVICFTPTSNAAGTVLRGYYRNINGAVLSFSNESGTYSFSQPTNSPAGGMGTVSFSGDVLGIAVNGIDNNGLAHGFQFTQIVPSTNVKILTGTASYQGP